MINTIRLRGVVEDDLCNYRKWSMFLVTSYCDFKCCHEGGFSEEVCQNEPMIAKTEVKEYSYESLYNAFVNNPITEAIVVGGLEPMQQFTELFGLIKYFRDKGDESEFVIYTGYYKNEIEDKVQLLKTFQNIIIKYGRYKPNQKSHRDEVLGVDLANDEQYAEKIS